MHLIRCPACKDQIDPVLFGDRLRISLWKPSFGCACPACGEPITWWQTYHASFLLPSLVFGLLLVSTSHWEWCIPAIVVTWSAILLLNPWLVMRGIVRLDRPATIDVVERILAINRWNRPDEIRAWIMRQRKMPALPADP